jgi:hypothetical protein
VKKDHKKDLRGQNVGHLVKKGGGEGGGGRRGE